MSVRWGLCALIAGLSAVTSPWIPAAAAAPTVINFETYPNGTAVPGGSEVTNQFAPLGMTFDSVRAPSASQVTTVVDYVPTTSGTKSLGPGGPKPSLGGTLILLFSPVVTRVGSALIDDQFAIQITAKDAAGTVVGSAASNPAIINESWSLAYAAGIARVEMTGGYFGAGNPDGWVIDDLAFDPVPEPTTGCTFVACAALVLLRRRTPSCVRAGAFA